METKEEKNYNAYVMKLLISTCDLFCAKCKERSQNEPGCKGDDLVHALLCINQALVIAGRI